MGSGSSGLESSIQSAGALLRAGVAAARSGQRERARDLLIRALRQDPRSAAGWLWLSGVVDRPDEQRYCLERVLALDPDNQAARRGLALLRRQEADRLVRAGIAAARAGQREHARTLLIRVLEEDPRHIPAWLWLSSVVDRPDAQRDCLERVLALDPGNQAARTGLALLEDRLKEQPAPAVVKPTPTKPRQQVSRPDVLTRRHRISRVAAIGVLAGAALVAVGLLVIRPSLAARVASWALLAPPADAATSSVTPVAPTLPPGEGSPTHYASTEHGQVAAGVAVTPTAGHRPLTSSPVPTVAPTVTPSPTATPTPVIYPPTRIVIPSIGVDAPVVLATSHITDAGGVVHQVWDVPEASFAGWHEGSATLAPMGNTVINGHNWPQNAVFRNLHLVQPGEPITLYSNDTPFFYEVAEVLLIHDAGQPWEVRQENARYIQHTDDERVTLFTCYPYGSIQNRLIVIARPVESMPDAENE